MKQRSLKNARRAAALLLLALLMILVPGGARARASDGGGLSPAQAASLFKMAAVLPTGSLGLPGEPVVWVLTVTNDAEAPLTDVIVSDVLRDELQIDTVQAERGDVAVSGQMLIVTAPVLPPGESMVVTLFTTVRRSPSNGMLVNQALLAASGPGGALNVAATAEVFVPTGLPPTGYPPTGELPGNGQPSLMTLALMAAAAVSLTAWHVYRRGRRW